MSDLLNVMGALQWLAQVLSLLYIAYRCLLGILSLRPHKHAPAGLYNTQFVILIPAHNEDTVVFNTVSWMKLLQYPQQQFQVVVIADGCTDRTEEFAIA